MRILKPVVIGMAVLIVLGMGLLVYGLATRSVNDVGATAVPERAPVTAFGTVNLPLPPGCAIADMAVADGRLYVRIGPQDPCARIYVLDAASGAVLGTVGAMP